MPKEFPRYRINSPFPGTQIVGVPGLVLPGTEIDLDATVVPKNSWIPLNDLAIECFKKRNDALLEKARTEGIDGSEPYDEAALSRLATKLKWNAERTPHMTSNDDDEKPGKVLKTSTPAPEPELPPKPGKVPNPVHAIAPPRAPGQSTPPKARASDS